MSKPNKQEYHGKLQLEEKNLMLFNFCSVLEVMEEYIDNNFENSKLKEIKQCVKQLRLKLYSQLLTCLKQAKQRKSCIPALLKIKVF